MQHLLDLDLGRDGGGYGRVKTAIENLIEVGVDRKKLLGTTMESSPPSSLRQCTSGRSMTSIISKDWVGSLRQHNVFFSSPLDLDMMMLEAFPDADAAIIPKGGGPDLTVEEAAVAVLKGKGAGLTIYTGKLEDIRALIPAYRYHFLTHSKPATHLQALSPLRRKVLSDGTPQILREVLMHVQTNLRRD